MLHTVNHKGELFRINSDLNAIEYSANEGRTWTTRYIGNTIGKFIDIINYRNNIYACTSTGLYKSQNRGRSWIAVYTGRWIGMFYSLQELGESLIANTTKGLFYSNDGGEVWMPKLY